MSEAADPIVQIVTEADAWQPDPRWRSAARLTVLLGEDDHWKHSPRYHEIVRRARDAGLAGASVWRGVEGYGVSSRIHTARMLDFAENLPVQVMIIDDAELLREFVAGNAELFVTGTVALSPVQVWNPGPEGRP
jgi:PII-like signaling protein